MNETITSVTEWATETFGDASIESQVGRALKEFSELCNLVYYTGGTPVNREAVAMECADVVICLYRVLGVLDPEAINKKMAINRSRTWRSNGDGTGQHV